MGIWDTHRAYYRMDLCANQRKKHMRDPLEIYVNDCHLGCKKGVFKPKLGKDGLCDVVLNVLDALRKRGYEEDLDPEIRDSIYCRINNDKKCKKLNLKLDEPFDTIFDQLSDKPYVKETQVPESTLYAEEAVNIADCLYGMSLKLALTAEHEDIIAKHNKENPEKNEGLAEKAFVHGAAKKV
ncbi:hypothetical protein DFP73DRAFT_546876 [Morchella snyderi]|nr:hypothetical protein DFP73DRAFT_546876 [Morchella snyderi]